MTIPEADISGIEMPDGALGFRVQQYGIHNFLGLFTKRQALALGVFAEEVERVREEIAESAAH
jgi:putative DNA methylase